MTAAPTHAFSLRSEGGGPELVKLEPGAFVTLGRDARNGAQIGHGSIELFHATLRCDDWGVWITPLTGARVVVAGEAAREERLIPLNAKVELGALRFELAAVDAPAAARRGGGFLHAVQRAIAMIASAAIHLLALWILRHFAVVDAEAPLPLAVHSEQIAPPADELVEPTPQPLPETELAAEVVPDIEPLLEMPAPDPEPVSDAESVSLADDVDAQVGPIRAGLGAAAGGAGMSGAGTLSLDDTEGLSRGFVARLKALRGSGVDLVFVIDATSSMGPFLEGARAAADSLVATLATVVADLRVGVVAYRDLGDDFTTRLLPLSADRYAVLNFLWSLRPQGGGDVPEAVAAGLEVAIEQAGWRPRTHHVIVVVGDAPPHVQDWPRVKTAAKRFSRSGAIPGAVISSIYTGAPRESVGNPEEEGSTALAEIARLGHGDYVDLGNTGSVGDRLLLLTLGPKHAQELQTLLSRVKDGPREQLVKKRVEEGDKAWLLAKLRRPPVHPAVIDALIDLADRKVLWEVRKLVADPGSPRESREAALYVLRRIFPVAADLDLDREPEAQREVMNRLDAQILRR